MVARSMTKAILEGVDEASVPEAPLPDKLQTIRGTYGGLTLGFYRGDGATSPMLELNLAGEGRSAHAVFWKEQVDELIAFLQSVQGEMSREG